MRPLAISQQPIFVEREEGRFGRNRETANVDGKWQAGDIGPAISLELRILLAGASGEPTRPEAPDAELPLTRPFSRHGFAGLIEP
jgi:hypothetical protein